MVGGATKLQLCIYNSVPHRRHAQWIAAAGRRRHVVRPAGLAQAAGCADISGASAYSLNITLLPQDGTPVSYLTLWPEGQIQPIVSTMNSLDGRNKANAAVVPAGVSGGVSVYVTNTANLLIDIDTESAPSTRTH